MTTAFPRHRFLGKRVGGKKIDFHFSDMGEQPDRTWLSVFEFDGHRVESRCPTAKIEAAQSPLMARYEFDKEAMKAEGLDISNAEPMKP